MTKRKISNNIFSNLPAVRAREVFQILAQERNFKIERIVSRGQKTPEGQWLCEPVPEWVMVLKGRARIAFKYSQKKIFLKPGDHFFIPAKKFHRVEWTDPRQRTVWLAVHGKHETKKCSEKKY